MNKTKVINIKKQTYNLSQDVYTYYGDCENCRAEVDINYNTYCGSCGKELDWSETLELREA